MNDDCLMMIDDFWDKSFITEKPINYKIADMLIWIFIDEWIFIEELNPKRYVEILYY